MYINRLVVFCCALLFSTQADHKQAILRLPKRIPAVKLFLIVGVQMTAVTAYKQRAAPLHPTQPSEFEHRSLSKAISGYCHFNIVDIIS